MPLDCVDDELIAAELEEMTRALPPSAEISLFERVADGELRYLLHRVGRTPTAEEIECEFASRH